jgi:ribonuclease HIII
LSDLPKESHVSSTATLKTSASASPRLREELARIGFSFRDVNHAFWQARGDATITFYRSGKLVVQGKTIEAFVAIAEAHGATLSKWSGPRGEAADDLDPPSFDGPFGAAVAKLPDPKPDAWIGIDEAGKGDYFGPLVTVAARVDVSQLELLAKLGVGDSKRIADKKIRKLAAQLRHVVPSRRVTLMPPKYNELYGSFGNLNKMLAWCHAAAAEALLESGVEAELILSDQFAKSDIVKRALKELGSQRRFVQRTKAEEDPAVACASIFARAEFLARMDELEETHGVSLHKGAGAPVLIDGRALVSTLGRDALASVAKLHFKTTQTLLGPA